MPRDKRAYLWDVIQAANEIQSFTNGKSVEDYLTSAILRAAVERKLEIIGEALSQALKYFPEISAGITDCGKIIAFRNRLIHGYSLVSDALVWDIVQEQIPKLLSEVDSLFQDPNKAGL